MLRGFHNSCLNQVLGHKSSAVSATNLFGYFDPAIGVEQGGEIIMDGWLNQIQNINLSHKNGMGGCLNNVYPECTDLPKHFFFDGLDKYISGGVSNEYSASQVPLILASSWTLTSWVKGISTDFVHILLSENSRAAYISLERSNAINTLKCRYFTDQNGEASGSQTYIYNISVTQTLTIPSTIDISKWNQITITQANNSAKFYINGNYVGTQACGISYSTYYLLIGRVATGMAYGQLQGHWTDNGIKLGLVLIYTSEITNSEDRQNFNALHQIKSNRIYGATYNA